MTDRLSLVRNVAMMSIASYAELAFGLIMGVVVARSLGSAEFGHYAFAVWVSGTLITLSNNALTMSSIKFIAEVRGSGQPDTAQALGAQLRRWQGMSSAIVLSIFVAIAVVHDPAEWRDSFALMVLLVVVGAWSRSGYTMLASIGKGNERFEVESAALLLSAAANLVLVLLLSLSGGSLVGFFGIYAVCGLLQNLTARIALRQLQIRPAFRPLPPTLAKRLRRHLLQSGALVLVGLLGDRTIEVLLLKTYSGSEAVGFFAIAGALTKGATYLLAGALSSVLLPTMSRAFGQGGTNSVVRMLHESLRYYWFLGLAIAGMGVTVAPGAVRLLYGQQYEAAIPAVVVNLMVAGFVLISAAFNAFQTSSDNQRDRIRIAALALGVNLVAGLALVPAFGLKGALGSLAITRIASVWFSWKFARRTQGMTLPATPMIRVLLSCLLACGLAGTFDMLVQGRFTFVGAGVIFVLAYGVSTVLMGAWTRSDYDMIAEVSGHLGGAGSAFVARIHALGTRFATKPQARVSSKRKVVTSLCRASGLTSGLGSMRSAFVNDLRVLAYHRVLPQLDEATFEFDIELVSARREEFEWQMAYIARRFNPVSCQQVADAFDSRTPLPKRAVMVTFDDGFLDNFEVAFPILQRHSVPAVFFLSTGYINTSEVFWFDWLVNALTRSSTRRIRLDTLDLTIELGTSLDARRDEAKELLSILKRTPEANRLQVLQELRSAVGSEAPAGDPAHSNLMTWDHVRQMSRAGMEFGSHTVSHPILSTISDPDLLRWELEESKATIERETGRPVIALAYPVGGRDAANDEVLAATSRAGYRFAFTYQTGVNMIRSVNRFRLKRLAVERYTTRDMFAAALELPEIFGTSGSPRKPGHRDQ